MRPSLYMYFIIPDLIAAPEPQQVNARRQPGNIHPGLPGECSFSIAEATQVGKDIAGHSIGPNIQFAINWIRKAPCSIFRK